MSPEASALARLRSLVFYLMENMKILKISGALLLTALLAFVTACRKSPSSAPAQAPGTEARLPMPSPRPSENSISGASALKDPAMERVLENQFAGRPAEKEAMRGAMSALDAKVNAEEKLAEHHRRTMVTPAPADFKPEPVARKVRLRLVLEKRIINAGAYPRFRLELTNVGRETIDYQEYSPSIFVKNGRMIDSPTIVFFLTDSRKNRKELMPVVFRSARPTPAGETFRVKLLPGETLHSVGDDDSPVENFKTLDAKGADGTIGKYQLHAELDDRPRPLTKGYIEANLRSGSTLEQIKKSHQEEMRAALGPVSSNAAEFEVTQ